MKIPIFKNYEEKIENIIGYIQSNENSGLLVTMQNGYEMTEKQIFSTFGNISFLVAEQFKNKSGDIVYKKFLIRNYSFIVL